MRRKLMSKKIEDKDKLIKDLDKLLRSTQNNKSIKRIQCIYFKLKYNKTPEEIGEMVGYNKNYVKQIQAKFWKKGDSVFNTKQRGGRRRENLTIEEEKAIVDEFKQKADNAEIIEASKIKECYEEKARKKVSKSTIYRMLKRHGWRKIAPRPTHPNSDSEAMDEFKKRIT
jgi:transposase